MMSPIQRYNRDCVEVFSKSNSIIIREVMRELCPRFISVFKIQFAGSGASAAADLITMLISLHLAGVSEEI
jgi:hypothetical protein